MESEAATLEILERQIAAIAGDLSRSLARWLSLIAQFDARGGGRRAGHRSTSAWLAWRCGLGARAARDHVRVARRLSELPLVAAAFARGELSYSKVRAIARADATADESALLKIARCSTAYQLELAVRQLRSAPSGDLDTAREAHARRFVDWWWQEDGSLRISGQLSPDEGAAFIEAIEAGAEALHAAPEEVIRPPLLARRANALSEIVLSGAPPAQVLLHVDPQSLGEICALEDGPAVPPESARRMACDGEVVDDLGRRRRVVSSSLRRALERRDGGCRFPGCVRRHGLHAHHLTHWAHGGPTDRDNLVLLCRFHHRLVHEDGFSIRVSGECLAFHRPDGRRIDEVPALEGRARAPALAVAA